MTAPKRCKAAPKRCKLYPEGRAGVRWDARRWDARCLRKGVPSGKMRTVRDSDRRSSQREPAHDILAAEAFAVPAPDPILRHHDPVKLPGDPTGIAEAHDILAAEEFAMPAPASGRLSGPRAALAVSARSPWRAAIGTAVAAIGALLLRRRPGE